MGISGDKNIQSRQAFQGRKRVFNLNPAPRWWIEEKISISSLYFHMYDFRGLPTIFSKYQLMSYYRTTTPQTLPPNPQIYECTCAHTHTHMTSVPFLSGIHNWHFRIRCWSSNIDLQLQRTRAPSELQWEILEQPRRSQTVAWVARPLKPLPHSSMRTQRGWAWRQKGQNVGSLTLSWGSSGVAIWECYR